MVLIPRRGLLPAAVFAAVAALSAPAGASPYTGLVVFGDSLSDAGQLADPGGPANATRRFTNRVGPTYTSGSGEVIGPVAPILLGERLGLGGLGASTSPVNAAAGIPDGDNWAVGGYRTDEILASIVAPGGSVAGSRSRDGYLVGRAADPNALYYVTGGGNDFLQGRIADADDAAGSARQLAQGVRALAQAGARTIVVWLLPDVGRTPALAGSPLQPAVSALGGAFNAELVAQLATVDAAVIPLDIPRLLDEVLANPLRYGLAVGEDLDGTCFDGCANRNPQYGLGGATPDPSRLLFNDGVHPTVAGHRLISDYAYSLLAAPWELTLLPELAHGALRSHQQRLREHQLTERGAWQPAGDWRGFFAGSGQRRDFDRQSAAVAADGDTYGVELGGSYRFDPNWRFGAAFGVFRQELETGDSDYQLDTYLASAFGEYQRGHWWADGQLNLGYLDYAQLDRRFALGVAKRRERGETDGRLWAATARVGFDLAAAGARWGFSPFLGAGYARVEVDGYSERGGQATTLRVDDQNTDSRRLGFGLQGHVDLGAASRLFAEVVREKEFEDDRSDVKLALVNLPGLRFQLAGYAPGDAETRAGLGFSWRPDETMMLTASYGYRHGDDDDQQDAMLALSWDW